jgi:uncharacterized NAD-dependent epimerase/dehydratase family protein
MPRIVIMAEGHFEWHYGKTATGVMRYGKDPVVAVIDSTRAGQDAAQALGSSDLGRGIPVVASIQEALSYQPDTLLIGVAPIGGDLPPEWRAQLLAAIEAGLTIVNGLHFFIAEDPELRAAAERRGVTIWDVRRPPERRVVASYRPHRPGSRTVLTVGSDCATGKMTVALELERAARARGLNSAFFATGQTGIMIAGSGLPVDRIISDFIAGMVEERTLELTARHDWVFVEGQGSINHPGYSPVTLGLLHGSLPDAMIFCHLAGATTIEGYPHCPLPPLRRLISMNEEVVNWLHREGNSKVVGIALITQHLPQEEALAAIRQVEEETGLPTTDVLRFGAAPLLDALLRHCGGA